MTTKYIDGSISGSSFPTTYVGPGTLAANCINSGGSMNMLTGNFSSDGSDIVIYCGFQPRHVEIYNSTDAVLWKKMVGMAAANAIKIDTAVATDTNSYILFNQPNVGEGVWTVSISSSLVSTSKAIAFEIRG